MTTTICVDGFNLAMPKGSGIASYARGLLDAIGDLEIETHVLYGPRMSRKSDKLLTEIELADALSINVRAGKMDRYWKTVFSPYGRTARAVETSGEVIWSSATGGRPPANGFWAARDLFYIANRSFERTGRFTPVEFAKDAVHKLPDAMHWTTVLPLRSKAAINIYTIHDLIPLKLPHTTRGDKSKFFEVCSGIARTADHIVAVSETTRRDLINILGVDEDRITNTYQTVDLDSVISDESNETSARIVEDVFGIPYEGYFLYYGAIEPKKNVGAIIDAYVASGSKRPLIIVAGRAWLEDDEIGFLGEISRHNGAVKDRIRKIDYLPRSMLARLVRCARATVFPSLYEGFGLPVVESMAAGTACLTSRIGALEEVAGGAALLVDPYDIAAIAKAIISLDCDDALVSELQTLGKIRAEFFLPEAHAKRLKTVYRRVGLLTG